VWSRLPGGWYPQRDWIKIALQRYAATCARTGFAEVDQPVDTQRFRASAREFFQIGGVALAKQN